MEQESTGTYIDLTRSNSEKDTTIKVKLRDHPLGIPFFPPVPTIEHDYQPRHSISSSLDSTNASFLSSDISIAPESLYRAPSPTPSDSSIHSTRLSTRSSRPRFRPYDRDASTSSRDSSSRESSVDRETGTGRHDEGLSELMEQTRVGRGRRGGYETESDFSDAASSVNSIHIDIEMKGTTRKSTISPSKSARRNRTVEEDDDDDDDEDLTDQSDDGDDDFKIKDEDDYIEFPSANGRVSTRATKTTRGPYVTKKSAKTSSSNQLSLDVEPNSTGDSLFEAYNSAAGSAKTNLTDIEKAADSELRRIAFEKMAGAFRAATTGTARDRAKSAFVQAWLSFSYELSPGGNVCRPAIYASYCRASDVAGVTPINSASFGKAMRQAFPKIKTRRLGVRGNSRYHYCGIGPRNATEAAILVEFGQDDVGDDSASSSAESGRSNRRYPAMVVKTIKIEQANAPVDQSSTLHSPIPPTPTTARPKNLDDLKGQSFSTDPPPLPRPTARRKRTVPEPIVLPIDPNFSGQSGEKTLGSKMNTTIPVSLRPIEELLKGFPDIESTLRRINTSSMVVDEDVVRVFYRSYAELSYSTIENMKAMEFGKLEKNINTFWTTLKKPTVAVILHPEISSIIYRADASVYHTILELLHSQILVPLPPTSFIALRTLSEGMERIQTEALSSFDGEAFPGPKIELAARFGHLLSRHLGLCQLGQALVGIVSPNGAIPTLAQSWENIDFEAIKNQSALVSNCAHELLTECFDRFKLLLHHPGTSPAESIIAWADQVYQTCLASSSATMSPRSLLIRFNFVTSQIMRDLVLRSEPSFGSWQIISLFLDDFLGFQVLRKVALQISAISETLGSPIYQEHQRTMEYQGSTPSFDNHSLHDPTTEFNYSSYGSSIAPSSSSFLAFDQFSPANNHAGQFIDPSAANMGMLEDDLHQPIYSNYSTQHRPSQQFAAQFTQMQQILDPNDPNSYQAYPPQFPPSSSLHAELPGSLHHYNPSTSYYDQQLGTVGLEIGTPSNHDDSGNHSSSNSYHGSYNDATFAFSYPQSGVNIG